MVSLIFQNMEGGDLMRTKKQKGQLGGIGQAAIALVVAAFLIGIGATVLSSLQGTQTANSVAYNVTGQGMTSMSTFGSWLPIIAVVASAVVVIGLLVVYLGGFGQSQQPA